MTPVKPVYVDPEGKCTVIEGSGSKSRPTAFDKRFAANRERSERLQARTEVVPLGSSELLVD